MVAGSGIEVIEEGERTRVVMPVSVALTSREAWKRSRRWRISVGVGALLVFLVMAIIGSQSELAFIRWALPAEFVLTVLIAGKIWIASGIFARTSSARRVEIVVDRWGVRQCGWGLFNVWRVRLKKARVVWVRPPLEPWREEGEEGRVATVRVVGRQWWSAVWGAYEPGVAREAAGILMQQIERVRGLLGVSGPALVMREAIELARVEGGGEKILEGLLPGTVRGTEGVRVELAQMRGYLRRFKETGLASEAGYLMSTQQLLSYYLYGLGMFVIGVTLGEVIGEGIGKGHGAWDVVGMAVIQVSMIGGLVWALAGMFARVTYEVGSWGVKRTTRVYGMERKRRWGREEIEGVYLRRWRFSKREWAVGIRKRGGRRVALAMGTQRCAEAFAEVLERELGVGRFD